MSLLAGVDVGTTNVKAAVFGPRGRAIAGAKVPTPARTPRPGWTEYDPDALWDAVCRALSVAVHDAGANRIDGVAVASMGESGVPVDRDGTPTRSIIAWFDPRTAPQLASLVDRVGGDRLTAITGTRPQAIHGICKLMWLREHDPAALRGTTWLNVADYVAHRLGAAAVTDRSLASRTLAYDLGAGEWSGEILDAARIDRGLLAPLVWSGETVGAVSAAAADATGLPAGTPIGAGGHDHVCGALAAGVVTHDRLLDSMGTAESYILPVAAPADGAGAAECGLSQGAHVVAGSHYLAGGLHAAGASLRWVLDLVGDGARDHELLSAAGELAPGSYEAVFVPHLRGAGPPFAGDGVRGAFVGLDADVEAPVLVRAVLDGLAFACRAAVEAIEEVADVRAGEIVAIGGGHRNDLLVRLKATLLGRPVTVLDVDEEVALGAALLGGVAAGVFDDAADAARWLDVPRRTVAPDGALGAVYEERYETSYLPAARHTVEP